MPLIKIRTVDFKSLGAVIFFLFFMVSNAHSLGWDDEAWRESNCPNNIMGEWVSESQSPLAGRQMVIDREGVSIIDEGGKTKSHRYQSNPVLSKDKNFIEFEISHVSEASAGSRFFRIRPHRVKSFKPSLDEEVNPSQCLIKLFRYASKSDIQLNRYLNWDIYQQVK